MRRVFVAIDISGKARCQVSDHIKTLRKQFSTRRVGWEKTEKLHLTLKFLGNISQIDLAKLEEIVGQIAGLFSVFRLKIANTGVFPNKPRAKILWLGIEDEKGSLEKIKETLETDLLRIGFTKEKRKYKPHLTIARLREPHKSKELVRGHLENKFEPVEFEVSEIVIYESELKPTGSVYQIISSYKLN